VFFWQHFFFFFFIFQPNFFFFFFFFFFVTLTGPNQPSSAGTTATPSAAGGSGSSGSGGDFEFGNADDVTGPSLNSGGLRPPESPSSSSLPCATAAGAAPNHDSVVLVQHTRAARVAIAGWSSGSDWTAAERRFEV
jgi:hypothetical protein